MPARERKQQEKFEGWKLIETSIGYYVERGHERQRLCSTRTHKETVQALFVDFARKHPRLIVEVAEA